MPLSIGIVGLPNVGKSTLFEAITNKQVDRENYPFCTVDPNVGVVAVPDKRVDQLASLVEAEDKIYPTVEFIDIAGLIEGANKGEGLGNQFLSHIQATDAIIYVLRAFSNPQVSSTQSVVDPQIEKQILDEELRLKDLEMINRRIDKLSGKQVEEEVEEELEALRSMKSILKEGSLLGDQDWDEGTQEIIQHYRFLTAKPRLYLLNGGVEEISSDILEVFREKDWPYLIIDVLTELEAEELSAEERKEYGLQVESALDQLIKKAYSVLNLITFFTIVSRKVRGWTLEQGKTAPEAGEVIHSDFRENFVKAEVISWEDLVDAGGYQQAKEEGLVKTRGKDYVIQEGDVIMIKTNA